jgi:hypothetical protein
MSSRVGSKRRLYASGGGRVSAGRLSQRSLIIFCLFLLQQQTCHPWPYLALTIFPKRAGTTYLHRHRQQQQHEQQDEKRQIHTRMAVAVAAAAASPTHPASRYNRKLGSDASSTKQQQRQPSLTFSWWQRVKKTSKLFSSTSQDESVQVRPALPDVVAPTTNDNNNNKKRKAQDKKPIMEPSPPPKKKNAMVKEFMYTDPMTNTTFKALNTCKRKFQAYLTYQGVSDVQIYSKNIACTQIELTPSVHAQKRIEWRDLWTKRQLLTDRTEFLARYQSDDDDTLPLQQSQSQPQSQQRRRGGFADLLHLYTERLLGILQDEQQDQEEGIVLNWLLTTYGLEPTNALLAPQFTKATQQEQLDRLQHFSEWFRSVLPYHYDRCSACGVSYKDETAAAAAAESKHENDNDEALLQRLEATEDDDTSQDDDDNGTFLGYIYPNDGELDGKASRTELYHCHKCHAFTRFPRFNAAQAIIQSKRGRCGEYSTLMYRLLRALGLEARWVVDWADHVWAEVLVMEGHDHNNIINNNKDKQRWVHIDPCEAAVDKNHLYQSWGKKQTYVMALYAPKATATTTTTEGTSSSSRNNKCVAPLVQDVTNEYTSDPWETIYKRRDESNQEVEQAIMKAVTTLAGKLGVSF